MRLTSWIWVVLALLGLAFDWPDMGVYSALILAAIYDVGSRIVGSTGQPSGERK